MADFRVEMKAPPPGLERFTGTQRVTLDRLLTLLAVQQHGGIARAARGPSGATDRVRAGLMSRQLKELRDALGLEVAVTSGRETRLTEAGEALARLFGRFVSDVDELREQSSLEAGPEVIRLGGGDFLLQSLVIPAVVGGAGEPRLALTAVTDEAALEQLSAGTLDAAILRTVDLLDARWETPSLGSWRLALYAARRTSRPVAERLRENPLALQSSDARVSLAVRRALEQHAGAPVQVRLDCETYAQVREAVLTGKCLGVLPTVMGAAAGLELLWELPLKQEPIRLVWPARFRNARPKLHARLMALRAQLRAAAR